MKLVSERLKMVPILENDWPLFYQLQTDPRVIELCFDRPSTLEIEAKFRSRLEPWTPDSGHWLLN